MIKLENLSFRYADQWVLRGIDLHVKEGEVLGLLGATGCGKTTLLRCMNGIIPQAIRGEMKGKAIVDGKSTRQHSLKELASSVGFVFQNPESQIVRHTVEDEVAFGPQMLGMDAVEERVNEALDSLSINHLAKKSAHELSGGEKQKLAIASIISMRPKIILFDEPLSSLDQRGIDDFLNIIDTLTKKHTIVIAEHNSYALAPVLTRVAIIERGEIALEGKAEKILTEERLLEKLGIEPVPYAEIIRRR
jgi:energy-coupling factor transporter ATP-binding protein EcfA2